MKRILFFLLTVLTAQLVNAQNVGIGTTTPNTSAQLDITSTTKGLLIPRMTGAQRAAIPAAAVGMMVIQTNTETTPPSSPGLYLREQVGPSLVWRRIARTDEITSGTSSWTVNGIDQYSNVAGNVGIGTSANINEKLTVKGDALFVYPGSSSVTLSLMGNTNNSSRIHFIRPDSSTLGSIYGWDLTDNLYLQAASNTNQLVLDQNSFVGIKTATPTEALDVVGSIRSRDTITADDDIVAGDDISAGDDITAGGDIIATGGISGGALITGGNITVFGTSLLTGNVTTNGDLIVNNTGITVNNAAGILTFKTGSNDKGFVQLSGDNLRVGTYSSNTNGKFIVRTGGGDHFTVDSDGNTAIGIDPVNLGAKFAVYGKSRAIANGGDALETTGKLVVNENFEAIRVKGNDPAINFFEGSTQRGYLWMVDNDMNLGTSISNGKINIQTSQVTIGTSIATPSTYKLGVGGRIICEEVKVKLQSAGWPDYVFAKDYKLKSLEEVENFIKANNHLPKIPSAQVIEKEGLEVGDMQRRMMEKIEELTLYIIDMQKQIDVLKKGIK